MDMPTGRQIKAARALLSMDAKTLSIEAKVTTDTVSNLETGTRNPQKSSITRIVQVLEHHGIEFLENEGVRRRPEGIETFEGPERFQDFTEAVYAELSAHGGDVCISASDEQFFLKYRKEPDLYRQNMKSLVSKGKVRFRILAEKSKFNSVFADMRKLNTQSIAPTSFYAFGKNLALISFDSRNPPYVVLLRNSPFADGHLDKRPLSAASD